MSVLLELIYVTTVLFVLTYGPWKTQVSNVPRHNSFVCLDVWSVENSGAIEETRIFIIIVIVFLSQAQRDFSAQITKQSEQSSGIKRISGAT